MESLFRAERAIAEIQTAQQAYNLAVKIVTPFGETTLANAIKLLGVAQRTEKLWRQAAGLEQSSRMRYAMDDGFSRPSVKVVEADKKVIEPVAQLDADALTKRVVDQNEIVGEFLAAISEGNAQRISLEIDQGLLE